MYKAFRQRWYQSNCGRSFFFVCVYVCACALMRERLFKAAHLLSVMNPKGLTTVHTTEETHTRADKITCTQHLQQLFILWQFCEIFHCHAYMTSVSCFLMWIPRLWNGWNLMYTFAVLHLSGSCSHDIILFVNSDMLQAYSSVHLTCITPNWK